MPLLGKKALAAALACAAVLVLDRGPARSEDKAPVVPSAPRVVRGSPVGVGLLDALGRHARSGLAPENGRIGALVGLPQGTNAKDLGLEHVATGIGRLRGSPERIRAFSDRHPDLLLEMAPPLHTLNDRANLFVRANQARSTRGATGAGVMVGVADTGLDVAHPDFRNEDGTTRVKWLLDLSLPPRGTHRALEERYGIQDDDGVIIRGAVFSERELNLGLEAMRLNVCDESKGVLCVPTDDVGHGTHVTGTAVARSIDGTPYGGIAQRADIVSVRVSSSDSIQEDLLVTAVEFMFDRADFEKKPMVVNISLGSDFGPHDGSFLWEKAIASYVGPEHPGHSIIVAAGNSGTIAEMPIHQSVYVSEGTPMLVPIRTRGAANGQVQVWITLRPGANMTIGLDGPDGTWIPPVERGRQDAKNTADYNAGIIYGSNLPNSPIGPDSNGAVVVWAGKWPAGDYNIRLEGKGVAELYMEGIGDVALGTERQATFTSAVREGTINLPATHPSIIGVGCTVNRPSWTSISGAEVALRQPVLDREGGLPIRRAITDQAPSAALRELYDGEVCWFSSSGPNAAGVPKPEIAAPGAVIVSAMSRDAQPGRPGSVFSTSVCPKNKDGADDRKCLQIDENHGIAEGTSMSSPIVAGVVALLLEVDPTLTQDKILALLQAGAHRYRTRTAFDDYAGPGEVDAMGSLDALDRMRDPASIMPALEQSWIALSSDWVAADGSTPLSAIVELRTADGEHRGDFFDSTRLQASVLVDGKPVTPAPAITRRGPGVWIYSWTPPPGLGGSRASFGASFDGAAIVAPKALPIGTDRWSAMYPSQASGSGCGVARGAYGAPPWGAALALALLALIVLRRS
ncbi:MAG: S8 family serine peptidase [Labilithrix sp.]|nr:S8 family serine peptidase [Labilithrix sp.]MCW5815507.1 S8 family serine peptidase [Labilithrix sp.]